MDYRSAVETHSEQHAGRSQSRDQNQELSPLDDLMQYVREYTREKPEVVALTCLGVGFILGWKLKPW